MTRVLKSDTLVPIGLVFAAIVGTVTAVAWVQAPANTLRDKITSTELEAVRQSERLASIELAIVKLETELKEQRKENSERWSAVVGLLTQINKGNR